MGVVESIPAAKVSQLVNASGADLVLSDLLNSKNGGRPVYPVHFLCPQYHTVIIHCEKVLTSSSFSYKSCCVSEQLQNSALQVITLSNVKKKCV